MAVVQAELLETIKMEDSKSVKAELLETIKTEEPLEKHSKKRSRRGVNYDESSDQDICHDLRMMFWILVGSL